MKTIARTDTAKFFCGFETFHSIANLTFWASGTPLTLLGMTFGPTWTMAGFFVHGAIAVVLGVYAWGGKPAVHGAPPRGTTAHAM